MFFSQSEHGTREYRFFIHDNIVADHLVQQADCRDRLTDTVRLAVKVLSPVLFLAGLETRLLIAADRKNILLDHHLKHADRFLALIKAVLKGVVLNYLTHRPCLSSNHRMRVIDVIFYRRWSLLVRIHS